MKQPKLFLDKFKLRRKAFGDERRLNMTKMILDKAPSFPLSVEYKDIDEAVQEWVDKDLDVSYDGVKLPTFKLFSNQRISEYAQNWRHLDEAGNLIMNFKTVTRENNPQQGKNQGEIFNIPGDRKYPMFMVPILQENGQQAYDLYSMKQPFCADMTYSVTLITNKYELLNEMNQLMLDKFKAINCYIAPNKHYMPMKLDSISDDSEYGIDDRKYYSQTFKIVVKAYIIKESDYSVTKIASRASIRLLGIDNKIKSKVQIEEDYIEDKCNQVDNINPYYKKRLTITVNIPVCEKKVEFNVDTDFNLTEVETNNVYDFILKVNGETQDLNQTVKFYDGDNIKIEISRDEYMNNSSIKFIGINPKIVIDGNYNPESSLDEPITDEDLIYNA